MPIAREHTHIFQAYVPEWLKYAALTITVLPVVLVFGAVTASMPHAMGYYGFSTGDVEFGLLVFYAVVTAYTPLSNDFFARLPAKTYLWISVTGQLLALYGCYRARSMGFLLCMRVISSMCNAGINGVCLNILFTKLRSKNAREIGYAFFYTMVLCSGLLCSWIGNATFDVRDLNYFYKVLMFSFLPGTILLTYILRNDVRLVPFKLLRVNQMGLVDCLLILIVFISLGYIAAYGQEYDWDKRIFRAGVIAAFFGLCEFLRFKYKQRPYLRIKSFKSRNFRMGLLLLFVLYIVRGAFNLTTTYFETVLETPFVEMTQLMLVTVAGIVAGGIISTYLLTRKISIRIIWLIGFNLLFIFYAVMHFRLNANTSMYYYVPLFIMDGIGQGMLMNPLIVFIVSSVPKNSSSSASAFAVMTRFLGFAGSFLLITFTEQWFPRIHQSIIGTKLNAANPQFTQQVQHMAGLLQLRGVLPDHAGGIATGMLAGAMHKELFIEYMMEYFQWMAVLSLAAILLIMLMPALTKTIINVRHKRPFGAGF